MTFLLFILSFLLVVGLTPFGLLFTSLKSTLNWNKEYWDNYYINLAISLDQFGNVAMSGLFNVTLINSDKHLFGRRLDALLNGIDKNHSIDSIEKW